MSKNAIFYFTGTGNSLKATKDIVQALGDCDVFFIPAYEEKTIAAGYERVGFVFPVYVGGPPLCVQKFLEETDFSPSKEAYFFSVATYGGTQGNTVFLINERLQTHGALLSAGFGINMWPQYIVMYDMPKIAALFSARYPQKIKALAEKIIRKESTRMPKRKAKSMNQDFVARCHDMDRDYNVSDNCTGCGLCVKVCPVNNIELSGGRPVFNHHCEQCVACIHTCPQRAINYKDKTQNRKRYIHPDIPVSELGVPWNNRA